MPRFIVRETFFRPVEHAREQSSLPAGLCNDLQLLLSRSDGSLFLPIRSMHYQAVAERGEVIFVDMHGGYARKGGEGGRLIRIAWRPEPIGARESLSAPVRCEFVYYFPAFKDVQRRLMREFPPVLRQILRQQRESEAQSPECRVLPLRPNARRRGSSRSGERV